MVINPSVSGLTDWRRLLFVMTMGALGSMIYFSSSFVSYVGNRNFRSSWVWFYVSRPFVGGALAIVFFFIIGSGMLEGTTPAELTKVAMVAALVGLFSDKAVNKLSDILDVILAPSDHRKDKLPESKTASQTTTTTTTTATTAATSAQIAATATQTSVKTGAAPEISSSDPATVKRSTATTVTFVGSNLENAVVKINDRSVQVIEPSPQSFKLQLTAEDTKGDKVSIAVSNAIGAVTFVVKTE